MRLVTGVLLLALALPGAAWAQGKPQGAPQGQREQAGTCSAAERQIIEQAFQDAYRMTLHAIRRLDQNPQLPEFRQWFGTAPVPQVRGNLVLILKHIGTRRPPALFCNPPDRCNPGTFAFVFTGSGGMGFCRLFFAARDGGFDSRPGIVVHEVSHVAIRTRDIAYSPPRAAQLAKDDPMAAMNNADNYEYFVESAGVNAPR